MLQGFRYHTIEVNQFMSDRLGYATYFGKTYLVLNVIIIVLNGIQCCKYRSSCFPLLFTERNDYPLLPCIAFVLLMTYDMHFARRCWWWGVRSPAERNMVILLRNSFCILFLCSQTLALVRLAAYGQWICTPACLGLLQSVATCIGFYKIIL